jgi:hypothetical protein
MVFEKNQQAHPMTASLFKKNATLLAVALPASAQACAVCMGSDDARIAYASNSVLWTLLSLVGFIFVATGSTVFYLWRKSKNTIPAHIQFIDSLTDEPTPEPFA